MNHPPSSFLLLTRRSHNSCNRNNYFKRSIIISHHANNDDDGDGDDDDVIVAGKRRSSSSLPRNGNSSYHFRHKQKPFPKQLTRPSPSYFVISSSQQSPSNRKTCFPAVRGDNRPFIANSSRVHDFTSNDHHHYHNHSVRHSFLTRRCSSGSPKQNGGENFREDCTDQTPIDDKEPQPQHLQPKSIFESSPSTPSTLTSKSSSNPLPPSALSPLPATETKLDPRTVYNLLKLSNFTKSEMDWRFDNIVQAGEEANLSASLNLPPFRAQGQSLQIKPQIRGKVDVDVDMDVDMNSVLSSFSSSESSSSNRDNRKENDSAAITTSKLKTFQYLLQHQHQQHDVHTRNIMHLQDLEAYLFDHYKHLENQWREKNQLEPLDDRNQQCNDKKARERTNRIQQFAKSDASSIFQLLLKHAPLQAEHNNVDGKTDTHHHNATTLTKQQFQTSLTALSSQIHYPTILPLAASMLLVGSSVGVISPVMPFVAEKLNLSSTHYGIVVSSFALMKMMGNVPSAILVERHGRKPYLVHSLFLVGAGVAGIGLSQDWMQLSLCRMTIGLGVAALTTASTLTVADVSTPLSRASAFSPVMSAFAAGTALGPALGGILCDEWGIRNTFLVVGASYGVLAVWNHLSLVETKRGEEWWEKERLPWHRRVVDSIVDDADGVTSKENKMREKESNNGGLTTTISNALRDTTEQWTELMNNPNVRPIVIMNGFYLCAISGSQMTLLPLLLTGGGATAASGAATGVALTATAVGQVYMWMSAVQVLGNPAAGRFADRAGKGAAIVAGGILTSAAMASVPLVCAYGFLGDGGSGILDASNLNWPLLAGTLGFWSLGGTLLATSHVAAISDAVPDSRRSQAIALLRTAGDVGFLCGAAGAGIAADMVGDVGLAMQFGSGVLMGATGWFGLQNFALWGLNNDKSGRK